MKSHKDLDVWRLAVDLATDVYEVTKSFPKEEQYGMDTQLEIAMRVNVTGLESLQRLQATAIRINQMLRGLARSVRREE